MATHAQEFAEKEFDAAASALGILIRPQSFQAAANDWYAFLAWALQ